MRHDRTTIWLVKYGHHAHRAAVAHAHNPIADYKKFDPNATVETFEMLAVSELVSLLEARVAESHQRIDSAIIDLLHRIRGYQEICT
ncbi:MAG: hypothetical protein K8F33_00060 [Thermomonas sp.]|uniref:hypothetical protein n=1 Tax=Thermomonas sp. TaxID=1971895 RepID=UPI001DF97D90|nr:hypothetical protein [Thermomonas sp.]MBZ0086487.1 hypothetical protein [Thermomonas sp.]